MRRSVATVGTARRGSSRRIGPLAVLFAVVLVCSFVLWYLVISDAAIRPGFGTNQQFFHRTTNRTSAVCSSFDGIDALPGSGVELTLDARTDPPTVMSIPNTATNRPISYIQIQSFGWGNPRSTHLYEDYVFLPEASLHEGYRSVFSESLYLPPGERARLPPGSPLFSLANVMDDKMWSAGGVNFGVIDGRRSALPISALPAEQEGVDLHHTLNPYAKSFHEGLQRSFVRYGPGSPLGHLCQAWESARHIEEGEIAVSLAHISDSLKLTVTGIGNVAVYVFRPGGVGLAWSMPEQWHNQFVPYTLGKNADGLDEAEVYTAQLRVGDVVIVVSDGVSDNLEKTAFTSVLSSQKLQSPISKQLVEIAELLGLGLSSTPFSTKAMQAGLFLQGGRQDDSSCVVASIASAQDLFARRAAMQAQSEAQARAQVQRGAQSRSLGSEARAQGLPAVLEPPLGWRLNEGGVAESP